MAHKEPRVECKIYLRPEERDHLKEVAKENEVSLSDLIRRTILKKYPMPKKKKSTAAEPQSPTPEDIKQWEKRLVEVNTILNKAYKGEKLPMDQYHALREEQAELRAKVGHN